MPTQNCDSQSESRDCCMLGRPRRVGRVRLNLWVRWCVSIGWCCRSDMHDFRATSGQTVRPWWATTREWNNNKQLCTTVTPPKPAPRLHGMNDNWNWTRPGILPDCVMGEQTLVHWAIQWRVKRMKFKNTISLRKKKIYIYQVIHQQQYFSLSSLTQIPQRITTVYSCWVFFFVFFVLVSVTLNPMSY